METTENTEDTENAAREERMAFGAFGVIGGFFSLRHTSKQPTDAAEEPQFLGLVAAVRPRWGLCAAYGAGNENEILVTRAISG